MKKDGKSFWKLMLGISLGLLIMVYGAQPQSESGTNTTETTSIEVATEDAIEQSVLDEDATAAATEGDTSEEEESEDEETEDETGTDNSEEDISNQESSFYESVWDVPPYNGSPCVEVNGDVPFFSDEEIAKGTTSFENYSTLDDLGRCGVAFASIGTDLLPAEERGEIGFIRPSGWHTVKYNGIIDGNYLYNRCHLIAYSLAGENANEQNLITGTRYLNVEGMLLYEELVVRYVERTGNHVLYRVTPIFEGNNLLCSGVLMEGYSVEDQGAGICFNVYAYNVQPYICIDYATGDSCLEEGVTTATEVSSEDTTEESKDENSEDSYEETTVEEYIAYVLNLNTKKFHHPWCSSVDDMSPKNRKDVNESRDVIIRWGYAPCKMCEP